MVNRALVDELVRLFVEQPLVVRVAAHDVRPKGTGVGVRGRRLRVIGCCAVAGIRTSSNTSPNLKNQPEPW